MICTEAEAQEKWCPYARVIFAPRETDTNKIAATTSYNRSSDPQPLANCIGSKCMAWKWSDRLEINDAGELESEKKGYCGA